MTNLRGDFRIDVRNGRITSIETDKHAIRFYAHHVSYDEWSNKWTVGFNFDAEEKIYSTSNHSTKISYYVPEGKTKEKVAEQVTQFIDKIMSEAGEQITPRFALSQVKP